MTRVKSLENLEKFEKIMKKIFLKSAKNVFNRATLITKVRGQI